MFAFLSCVARSLVPSCPQSTPQQEASGGALVLTAAALPAPNTDTAAGEAAESSTSQATESPATSSFDTPRSLRATARVPEGTFRRIGMPPDGRLRGAPRGGGRARGGRGRARGRQGSNLRTMSHDNQERESTPMSQDEPEEQQEARTQSLTGFEPMEEDRVRSGDRPVANDLCSA